MSEYKTTTGSNGPNTGREDQLEAETSVPINMRPSIDVQTVPSSTSSTTGSTGSSSVYVKSTSPLRLETPRTPPFRSKSSPPFSPGSPNSNSSPGPESPVTPNSSSHFRNHDPIPLILSSPLYNDHDDLIPLPFSKSTLSRTSSQRSSHNVHIQPKVSMADVPVDSGLFNLSLPYEPTAPLITYPRVLDISAFGSTYPAQVNNPGGSAEINLLGTGNFCKTVLSQPDPVTGQVFAVKIPKNNAQGALIRHEAAILSLVYEDTSTSIPGIISFYGIVETTLDDVSLTGIAMKVYQQTCQTFLSTFDPFSPSNNINTSSEASSFISFTDPFIGFALWKKWASQLIDGLLFLQSKQIVHCDIKPDNILLDENLNAHIGDFSSAQTDSELNSSTTTATSSIQTSDYNSNSSPTTHKSLSFGAFAMQFSAPELLQPPNSPDLSMPNFSTDAYSLGLTLLNFATGSEPFSSAVKHVTQKLMWARKGAALQACSPEDNLRLTTIRPTLTSFLVTRAPLAEIKASLCSL
ncbi:protein kinase PKH3 [Sugiyamaella lignohabitans]|uniref:mitogen-activated protein kinase kinase n=1 Tax=Sugiyamaella lignohabitans TaxID=796027 RepID=A0A167CVV6_9ASCO|nr:protein kinase PKH3 [Sugiyamaella lignohabitans]ANB12165.1 protein kinase PKH3 [Sugiyamaella lignohabitans]